MLVRTSITSYTNLENIGKIILFSLIRSSKSVTIEGLVD